MPVKIEFETSNAAFADWGYLEVASILEAIGKAADCLNTSGEVRDSNGNRIGAWSATIDAEQEEESNG